MEDFHEIRDPGCCLICEDSYDGCICYNCKCSKCEWYSANHPAGSESYDYVNDKEVCVLVDFLKAQQQERWEESQKKSIFKINNIIKSTEKAMQCTLTNTKTNSISNTIFWIPLSVLTKDKFIKNWFAEKEIIKKFNEGIQPQRKLF